MQILDEKALEQGVKRIVSALHPERVYLYGSHAYGKPHPDSDVDLLIVMEDVSVPVTQTTISAYRLLRGLRIPVEIKVLRRTEFARRTDWLNSIERTVAEKGRLLYERAAR